ncbi:MAG: phosphate regulon sensor histidine kinase PhoR [Gammaproteobacteria bacterium]|nr:phosphate regulon sensor histidine kinase PhoR [Gammaproteobacteria bacterium]
MPGGLRAEILLVGGVAVLGLVLGLLAGHVWAGLSLGLGLVVMRLLWVVTRLARWLERPETPPSRYAGGWLADLGQRLRRARAAQRRRERRWLRLIREYRRAADALPDAIVALDADNRILGFNPPSRQQLGLRQRDIGLPIDHLIRQPAFLDYLHGEDWARDVEVPASDDPGRILNMHIFPYGQGRRLLVVRDVTHLQRLQAMRQDFVANVSHELRTPLTVLAGYIETLLDTEELAPDLARILAQMHQQSERMRRIVEDLLLLSRLETTSPSEDQFEPVNVPAMLSTIADVAEQLSASEHHHIVQNIDPTLSMRGMPRELDSLFSNLVFNAVKYTPANGMISIRWFADAHGLVFEVEDTGIGIAPEHIPRLTERFYRVDVGRSRARGGTGLGLAIVKHVLLRHGGRLEIESTLGKGSLFRCLFPANLAMRTAPVIKPSSFFHELDTPCREHVP